MKHVFIFITVFLSFLCHKYNIDFTDNISFKMKPKLEVFNNQEHNNLSKSKYNTVKIYAKNTIKKSDTISLMSFGVYGNGEDETKKIQQALNSSVGKILYIPKQKKSYYKIRQLIIPNNIKIICDPSVIFMGSDDLNQSIESFEVMFRFENSENVTFNGQGALFKMNKMAYYSEHNHIFMINGGQNINLQNLHIKDSGGDAIFVGAVRSKYNFSKNISILNCKASNSRRQGLSIISVDGLFVSESFFNNSNGTSPECGVDIEPKNHKDILTKIRIVNSKAIGNKKRGFLINLNRLNKQSKPVDIIFENCTADKNMEGFSNRQYREVKGKIEFKNCISKNSIVSGFTESSCLASSVEKKYINCVVENSNTRGKKMNEYLFKGGFYLSGSKKDKYEIIGNSQLINCKSIITSGSKKIDYGIVIDNGGNEIGNIHLNNFTIKGGHKNKVYIDKKVKKSLKID